MVILKEPGRTVDVEFDSGGCDLLYGEITGVGDMANVRFNQIVMPDGTSDGLSAGVSNTAWNSRGRIIC